MKVSSNAVRSFRVAIRGSRSGGRDQVHLVQHEPGAAAALGQPGRDAAHGVAGAGLCVHQQQRDVCLLGAGPGGIHHGAVELALGGEDAGRIHQQHLGLAAHEDAEHAEAGGLRLRADDGQLGAGHAVQQGGLAGVRGADQGGEAAPRHAGPPGSCRCLGHAGAWVMQAPGSCGQLPHQVGRGVPARRPAWCWRCRCRCGQERIRSR